MRIFILGLLAIGSMPPCSIAYPSANHQTLFAYPSRGEFPVQSALVKGYLRYTDANGSERIVEYKYPEPLFAVRQYYAPANTPAVVRYQVRYGEENDSGLYGKASEAHFRAWVLQQYQALKFEIDTLRVAGKEPSRDILDKFRPLEKIALTADYASIAELPEIKQLRERHLELWNAAQLKSLQHENVKYEVYGEQQQQQQSVAHTVQPQGEIKTFAVVRNVLVQPIQESANAVQQQQQPNDGLTEVERATREHLRLWNEAKLLAEKASESDSLHGTHETANKQMISEHLKYDQSVHQHHQQHQQKQSVENFSGLRGSFADVKQAGVVEHQEHQHIVADTPEVVKAREEHLRLVNEANVKVNAAEHAQQQHSVAHSSAFKAHFSADHQHSAAQQHYVADTPEVVKAREEHLRLVNEAKAQIDAVQKLQDNSQRKTVSQASEQHTQQHSIEHGSAFRDSFSAGQQHFVAQNQQQQQVVDTPEVVRAREEHLRVVNEAKRLVEAAEQHRQQLEQATSQGHSQLKTDFQQTISQGQAQLKTDFQQQTASHAVVTQQQQQAIADTAEVVKAREEHLRAVNAAKIRVQAAEALKGQAFVIESAQQPQQQQQGIEQVSGLRSSFPEAQHVAPIAVVQQQQIVDTPEVVKARAEHLRLVNEANLKAQAYEQQAQHGQIKTDFKQVAYVSAAEQPVPDTAEVIKAREEHLRLVNEAKLQVQTAEQLKSQVQQQLQTQQIVQPTFENRFNIETETGLKKTEFGSQKQQQNTFAVSHAQHQVADTPEVIKAREEHLRLVNEAKQRAQSVEQEEFKYKNIPQIPVLKTAEPQPAAAVHYTPEVIKAREEHLRLVGQTQAHAQQQQQTVVPQQLPATYQAVQQQVPSGIYALKNLQPVSQQKEQTPVVETPEVQKAREEHLRTFNHIQAHIDQLHTENKARLELEKSPEEIQNIKRIQEEKLEQQQQLERERIQLQAEQMREAERLAIEQQEMEAELIRLRLEEEQRLQMEKLEELNYLKEQQDFSQQRKTEEYAVVGQAEGQQNAAALIELQPLQQSAFGKAIVQQTGQQQQQFVENPTFAARFGPNIVQAAQAQQQQQSAQQQAVVQQSNVVFNQQQRNYALNPFFKSVYAPVPVVSSNVAQTSATQSSPYVRYIQQSAQQQNTASQHQFNKKHSNVYTKAGYGQGETSYQPADTAVAFDQLEQARQEHFRAHDLALERLRLARLQDASLKDCN